ncbi:uncharacterized protein LOC122650512 [Telopea speciosissima]|uniref:uncharacterized protein LOC122650512 n=1 Tax=Telopea speciosissima TaxID=54955 RepID=UPI001CC51DFA|nr:uncharacterized protein LOC122650512 [Telopea speciosissima]
MSEPQKRDQKSDPMGILESVPDRAHDHVKPEKCDQEDVHRPVAPFDAGPFAKPPSRGSAGVTSTIIGGPAAGASSSSSNKAKAFARNICITEGTNKKAKSLPSISFSDQDFGDIQTPHDDALVVTMGIANFDVKRILVDNGSSADILFGATYDLMDLSHNCLKPVEYPLQGFSGSQVKVSGSIDLPLTAGSEDLQSTVMITFLVVDVPSSYNAILGRIGLNALHAIISMPHLKMKFLVKDGISECKGNQLASRKCCATSLRGKFVHAEALPIFVEDLRDDTTLGRAKSAEDLSLIDLVEGDSSWQLQIGSHLQGPQRLLMIDFLHDNADVFAWCAADMPGIARSVIEHKLSVDPTRKPVRQKAQNFGVDRQGHIQDEVQKLLSAGFIQEISYPEWLSNVVMVPKPGGKWRICIDYTDLNKACPKDTYPLPKIDQLIDATAGYEILSFMDAYSEYNQIKMYELEVPKTSFLTNDIQFCYLVMPFGLKNAGATYQRLVNRIFKKLTRNTMEAYVDDMLVKSIHSADHLNDLDASF